MTLAIRSFEEDDWPRVWAIIRHVVRAADTFTYDPAMTETEARALWLPSAAGETVVAVDVDGIVGTARLGPNRAGPGAHVATASFMVAPPARGRGVGSALCAFALDWARTQGFAGMQFNAVAETNAAAVTVYQRLGFTIVGTVPGAFLHPTQGRVGLHVMYCEL